VSNTETWLNTQLYYESPFNTCMYMYVFSEMSTGINDGFTFMLASCSLWDMPSSVYDHLGVNVLHLYKDWIVLFRIIKG